MKAIATIQSFPIEIYRIIRDLLLYYELPYDYHFHSWNPISQENEERNRSWRNFLSICKNPIWTEIRKELMIYSLSSFYSKKFLENELFREKVLSKLMNPLHQLGLKLSKKSTISSPLMIDLYSLELSEKSFEFPWTSQIKHVVMFNRNQEENCFSNVFTSFSTTLYSFTEGSQYTIPTDLSNITRLKIFGVRPFTKSFESVSFHPDKLLELSFPYSQQVDFRLFKNLLRLCLSFTHARFMEMNLPDISLELPSLKRLTFTAINQMKIFKKLNCPKLTHIRYEFESWNRSTNEDRIQFFKAFIAIPSVVDVSIRNYRFMAEEVEELCWKCQSLCLIRTAIDSFSIINSANNSQVSKKITFGNQLVELILMDNIHPPDLFDFNSFQSTSLLKVFDYFPVDTSASFNFPLHKYDNLLAIIRNLRQVHLMQVDTSDSDQVIDLSLFQEIRSISLSHCKKLINFHCLGKKQEYLCLSGCPDVTNEDLIHFSSILRLNISECPSITSIASLTDNYIVIARDLSLLSPVDIHLKNAFSVNIESQESSIEMVRVFGQIEKLIVNEDSQVIEMTEAGASIHQRGPPFS